MSRAAILLLLLVAMPLHAAGIEAGGEHVMAMLQGDSGNLDLPSNRGFGAHVEVFWSEHFSTRADATFLNPAAHLDGTDLGTLGLDIYSATARYHFATRHRLSAFAGGGVSLVSVGDLDDQYAEQIQVEFDPQTTFVVEGGLRYRVHPHIVLEVSAAYLPLELDAPAPLPPTIGIDPLLISAGASWRF